MPKAKALAKKKVEQGRTSNRPKTPMPGTKMFSSTYQPDPKRKSEGMQSRNARIRIQMALEATLEEMLKDPMTDTLRLTDFLKSMPKDKTIVQAITGILMRDAINPITTAKDRMKLLETLIKTGYGDKMDVTSNGKTIKGGTIVFSDDFTAKPN